MNLPLTSGVEHSPRLADVQPRTLQTDDGVELYYEVLDVAGPEAPALLLANGLGGKLYAWEPLLERFAETYRIVTWDYRGLFRSTRPARMKDLSIRDHAADAFRLLDAEGIDRAAAIVGWSMGVQVGLEAALERPERIGRLVLLNGTFGHAFQSALQPWVRVSGVPRLLHATVERLTHPDSWVASGIRSLACTKAHTRAVGLLLRTLFGNPRLEDMYRQYVHDVFGSSFPIYMRLFQELDAHSVYHQLPEVVQRTLVISGGIDWLTPANRSFAVARRIPRAEHLHLLLGSHFALIEQSDRVMDRIEAFLEG